MAWKADKKWIQQQFPWIQLSPLRQSVSIQSYTKSILQRPAPKDEGTKKHPFLFREVQVQGDCLCSRWAIPPCDHSHPSVPALHSHEQTGSRGDTKTLRRQEGKQTQGRGWRGGPTARDVAVASLSQDTSTSTNSTSSLGEPLTSISDALPEHSSPQVRDCADLHAVGQHVQRSYTAWKREAAE